jgi:hypothetical protein
VNDEGEEREDLYIVVCSSRIGRHTHRARLACFSMSKTNIHLRREVFERCVGWSNARSSHKRLILVFLKTSGRET